ncbi:MAG: hypothetical protein AAF367_06380 [Pseudomonadota bacterium]
MSKDARTIVSIVRIRLAAFIARYHQPISMRHLVAVVPVRHRNRIATCALSMGEAAGDRDKGDQYGSNETKHKDMIDFPVRGRSSGFLVRHVLVRVIISPSGASTQCKARIAEPSNPFRTQLQSPSLTGNARQMTS